jgi:toxin CcdB
MAQWTVYRNRNSETASEIPFLVDVQSDLLSQLGTRVVVPLYRTDGACLQPITRLTPEVEIEGEACLLMTPQLAGIATRELGTPVGTLNERRSEIVAALDLLITGF